MAFFYSAFGLTINCEFELHGMMPGDANSESDVNIRLASLPDDLGDDSHKALRFSITKNEFLLRVDNVGKYLTSNGNSILVDPVSEDPREIQMFLFGSAFGALLHQRNDLILHASAVQIGGKAMLFCGKSGSGKSTTAQAFVMKGGTLLSDDVCRIEFLNGTPYVHPAFPKQKMWPDSLEWLDLESGDLPSIRPGVEKRELPVASAFVTKPVPVGNVYFIFMHTGEEVSMEPVIGPDAFECIRLNTYRFRLIKLMGKQKEHFKNVVRLANAITPRKIRRPVNGTKQLMNDFIRAVENDISIQ